MTAIRSQWTSSSSRLDEISSTPAPAKGSHPKVTQHLLGRRNVKSGSRLVADEDTWLKGKLPGQQRTLDIASRELGNRLVGIAGLNGEAGDQLLGEVFDGTTVCPDAVRKWRIGDVLEREVGGKARSRHAADCQPLGRRHSDPGRDHRWNTRVSHAVAIDLKAAGFDVAFTREHLDQFLLPIAIDSGNAEHIAPRQHQ